MDFFKQLNNNKATSYDFYDTRISKGNTKLRNKDKRMLHKMSRSRLKQQLRGEDN